MSDGTLVGLVFIIIGAILSIIALVGMLTHNDLSDFINLFLIFSNFNIVIGFIIVHFFDKDDKK